jgi:hypothetical protein
MHNSALLLGLLLLLPAGADVAVEYKHDFGSTSLLPKQQADQQHWCCGSPDR